MDLRNLIFTLSAFFLVSCSNKETLEKKDAENISRGDYSWLF